MDLGGIKNEWNSISTRDETNTADATADLYKQIDEDDDTKLMPGESYYR